MQDLTGGEAKAEASGGTVREIIASPEASYPGFRARLCEDDDVRHHFSVIEGGQVSGLADAGGGIRGGEIQFVPRVHGSA